MLITPNKVVNAEYDLSHSAAEEVSRSWSILLLNGLLLIVAGVLIFSIDWSIRSLATFIGALFIVEGIATATSVAIDSDTRKNNVIIGLLSAAAGVAIIVWPSPGLVVVSVFLGVWLIVTGTATIAGSIAASDIIPSWWMWLIVGLLEIPLGVLALADPGATLAALVTVAGIWAVAIGVTEILLSFEVKRLPHQVDVAFREGQIENGRRAASPSTTSTSRVPDAQASR